MYYNCFLTKLWSHEFLELTCHESFQSSRFATWQKSQDKNLNILRTKRAFAVRWKAFFITCKGLTVAKNYIWPESAPLNVAKYILNCVSWNILKEVFHSVSSP